MGWGENAVHTGYNNFVIDFPIFLVYLYTPSGKCIYKYSFAPRGNTKKYNKIIILTSCRDGDMIYL